MSYDNLKTQLTRLMACIAIAPILWAPCAAQSPAFRQPIQPNQSTSSTGTVRAAAAGSSVNETFAAGSTYSESFNTQPSEPFGGAPMQGKTRAADYYSKKLILKVAIPSKVFSESGKHAYKSLYERKFISSVCVGGNLKCEISEYDTDPRISEKFGQLRKIEDKRLPPGMDILVWGSDIRLNKRAEDSLFNQNMDFFFEEGKITKLKKKYLRFNEPWRKPLIVGAQPDSIVEAREVCRKIKANCTFILNKDFSVLDNKFKVNEIDLIIGDSWVFESKDLEDRIGQSMPD